MSAVALVAAVPSSPSAPSRDEWDRRFTNRAADAPQGISTNGKAFDGQSFDYVIVGGGTAGLVLANRLSANSSISVAVIEAGPTDEGSTSINTPAANVRDAFLISSYSGSCTDHLLGLPCLAGVRIGCGNGL